ncbi:hypothetical protein [Haloferax chudinovii]|uniref:Ig-like domain-containing protein n=1 Tax=Haloferax chudinovii TaxID=1109010 RepID=A0ABD5XQE2_9EURY
MVSRRTVLKWCILGLSMSFSGCTEQNEPDTTSSDTGSEIPPSPSMPSCESSNSTGGRQTKPPSNNSATQTTQTISSDSDGTGTPYGTNTETILEIRNFDSEPHTVWITVDEGDERTFESWVALCPGEDKILLYPEATEPLTIYVKVANDEEFRATWEVSGKGEIGGILIENDGEVRFLPYFEE